MIRAWPLLRDIAGSELIWATSRPSSTDDDRRPGGRLRFPGPGTSPARLWHSLRPVPTAARAVAGGECRPDCRRRKLIGRFGSPTGLLLEATKVAVRFDAHDPFRRPDQGHGLGRARSASGAYAHGGIRWGPAGCAIVRRPVDCAARGPGSRAGVSGRYAWACSTVRTADTLPSS